MATTYSNECWKNLAVEHNCFYARVKAKHGNVVSVRVMKAYTVKYSSTYFNLGAQYMCSTSHPYKKPFHTRPGGLKRRSGRFVEEKNPLPLP
jgi:hypothetical protein